jgi:hypothetical protein
MPRRTMLPAVTVAVLAGATAASASATTLTVNTKVDTADPSVCSLRNAIAAIDAPGADTSACPAAAFGANTITLGAGTYDLFAGELKVAATVTNLTIVGAGEGQTTIAGHPGSSDSGRLFEIQGGATVTIHDLTLTGGHAPDGSPALLPALDGRAGANGGAILNAGVLTLTDMAISTSSAGTGGPGAPATVAGAGSTGGAGGSGGGVYNSGALTLTGVTLADDHAGSGGHGGLAGTNPSGAGGNGGSGGAGGSGGGIASQNANVTIQNSTIRASSAGGGGPGGQAGDGSTTGGSGGPGGNGGNGGGLASSGESLTIANVTIASSVAGNAGVGGTGGSGPTAGAGGSGGVGGAGGALYASDTPGANLQSVTVAGNSGGQGAAAGVAGQGAAPAGSPPTAGAAGRAGGIDAGTSAIAIQNSLLASNAGGNCGGAITDAGHNLSFGDGSCPATFASGDPNLGALQDNGGPAPTISLAVGSAALDQVPASGAGCPSTDERGVKRPSGTACDIGAYETAPPVLAGAAAKDLTSGAATLGVMLTPNAGSAAVELDYGSTSKYGHRVVVRAPGGVVAAQLQIPVHGLKELSTYHFRFVVATQDGVAATPDATFRTAIATVSKLKVSPSMFRAGARGTISYRASESGLTMFTALRRAGKRYVRIGSFRHHETAGANRFPLPGRIGARKLTSGQYMLQATPRTSGGVGRTATAAFIVK